MQRLICYRTLRNLRERGCDLCRNRLAEGFGKLSVIAANECVLLFLRRRIVPSESDGERRNARAAKALALMQPPALRA